MQEPSFSDRIVYETRLVRIGAFRCDRDHPDFRDTGPANNDCFVFPRTAVLIEHEHEPPFAASPNITTFYNRSQRYQRHKISERGDRCDWFGVDRSVARDAVRMVDPAVEENPFRWTRGRCDAQTYLMQRCLFDGVVPGTITDSIEVEETVMLLLDRVIGGAAATSPSPKRRAVVHEVECLLATRFDQPLTLSQIASQVGASVYHLCRTFREDTGLALHQYLNQLRIRHGLETVCESTRPLSRIAVDLGFAHHSHFTNTFQREFGVTPSKLRRSRSRC
jgi:AraC family transcriptional regulator